MDAVRPFVAGRLRGEVLAVAGVTAADVIAFVLVVCSGRAPGSAKLIVCALRSLLGWLHLTGTVPVSLAGGAVGGGLAAVQSAEGSGAGSAAQAAGQL
jgi:hypothetical protein